MSKGRPLDPQQRNRVVVLSALNLDAWTAIRKVALDRNVPLARVVEEALIGYLKENVRQTNG